MDKKAWFVIIMLLISFLLLFGTVTKNQNEKIALLEHNLEAAKDTLQAQKLENGELLTEKETLILKRREIYDELNVAKKDIKNLEKTLKNKIAYISKLEANIKFKDTIWMKPDTVFITPHNTVKKFVWKDEWASINSTIYGDSIKNSKMTIDNLSVVAPIQIGLTEDYTFWVKTANPYITFSNIESAVIDGSSVKKKEKRFHQGIFVGFGLNYGLIHQSWDLGPNFGYGFMFSF